MSATLLAVLLVVLGYGSGSVPYGLVLTRLWAGVDVRRVGSGNIGATNAARAGGKALGVAVLALDALKAVLPILLARALLTGEAEVELLVTAVGVAAFLGHVFPVWLAFRGGKGVATGLGVFLVLAPVAALLGAAAFAVVYASSRISSLGSLAGTVACCGSAFLVCGGKSPVPWAGLLIALVVVLRHRENIVRLYRGEERRMRV
ncbi:MAG TPA: glycerol-3-phosphate 1-O-acyltransferase PlsY [Anaeromyxobacter sp.]|nr:glycerol-3-phosphate 1-O-acyltransferase PlsY [Anaeromyxobacter sp.]